MERVKFQYKRGGRVVTVSSRQAELLSRRGLGEVANRSMADKPQVTKVFEPVPVAPPVQEAVNDGLEDLDKAELHAIAKERGIVVHHAAGADKVRQALREAQ